MSRKKSALISSLIILAVLSGSVFTYMFVIRNWYAPVRISEDTISSFAQAETIFDRKEAVDSYLNDQSKALAKEEIYAVYGESDSNDRRVGEVFKVGDDYAREQQRYEEDGRQVLLLEYSSKEVDATGISDEGVSVYISEKPEYVPTGKPKPGDMESLNEFLEHRETIQGVKNQIYLEYGENMPIFDSLSKEGEINGVAYYIPPWQVTHTDMGMPDWLDSDRTVEMAFETETVCIYVSAYPAKVSPNGEWAMLDAVLADVANVVNAGL